MGACFVIQPFDKGPFDKRYADVVAPAIRSAGLEPYRVDQDPAASVPIEQIEAGIRNASVCLADISSDNPNVWYEVGFAFGARKEVVLVSSAGARPHFPFDIQHRHVLTYQTDSPRDFADLSGRITARLTAVLNKEATVAAVASPLAPVHGLEAHELVALVALGQNASTPEDPVAVYQIRQDIERAGFTPIAATLALGSLLKKQLVVFSQEESDYQGNSFPAYRLSGEGFNWLTANLDKLALVKPPKLPTVSADDDVPF